MSLVSLLLSTLIIHVTKFVKKYGNLMATNPAALTLSLLSYFMTELLAEWWTCGTTSVPWGPSGGQNEHHSWSYLWLPGSRKELQIRSSESRLGNACRCCCAGCWSRCCTRNPENYCDDSRLLSHNPVLWEQEGFSCSSALFGISSRGIRWSEQELT